MVPALESVGFTLENLPDEAKAADGGLILLPGWISREQLLETTIFMLKRANIYHLVRKPRNAELDEAQQEHNKMVKMAHAFEKEKSVAIAKAERQKRDALEAEAAAAAVQLEIAKTHDANTKLADKLSSIRTMSIAQGSLPSLPSFPITTPLPNPSLPGLTSAQFRQAALRFHPDKGGSFEDWYRLQEQYQRLPMITWPDGAETPAADAPAAGDKKQVRRARERKTEEARADKEQRLRAGAPGGSVVIVSSATHAYIVATEGGVLPTTFAPTAFQHGVVLCAVARLPKQGDAEWMQTGTRVNLPAKQDAGVFICAYKVEGGIVCLILKSDGSVIKPRLSSVTVFSHMDMSSDEIRKLHERGRAEI